MSSIELATRNDLEDEKEASQHIDKPGYPEQQTDVLHTKWDEVSIINTVKIFRKSIFYCCIAAFSAACDGYQIGINGNIIANPGFIATFGNQVDPSTGEVILSASTLSAFGSMISAGQIIGMWSLPFIMDKYGRKIAMYIFVSVLTVSVIFESVADRWQLWLVGKLLAGIGVGCMQLTIPTYIAEISPYKVRGAMVAGYNIWWSVGSIFAPVALQVLSRSRPLDWKTPIYSQWAMVGLMIIIYAIVPESPWWCANAGRHDQGRAVLKRLHGTISSYNVEEEYEIILRTVALEREAAVAANNLSFTAIFKGVNGLRTLAAMWSLVTSQFLGLALIYNYITYFFILAGQEDPFENTVINSCVSLIAVIFTLLTVDKIGRRWILLSAVTICWIASLLMGSLSLISNPSTAVGSSLVFLANLWTFANNMNYTASWAMMAEVPSSRLRAKTAGFAASCSAMAGLTFSIVTPYLINVNNANWGLKTMFFYFGIGTPFVVAAFFIIPETARRSPAELDELYESRVKPWRFHKTDLSGHQSQTLE